MTEATPEPSAPKPAAPPAVTADDLKSIVASVVSMSIAEAAVPGDQTAADVFADADAYFGRMESAMKPIVLQSLAPNDAEFQAIAKQVSDLTTMAEGIGAIVKVAVGILKEQGVLAALIA